VFMIEVAADSYYALLGVAPDATPKQIRDARARIYTDLNERSRVELDNRAELEERKTFINGVAATLVNPTKRAEYDRANSSLRFFAARSAAAPLFIHPEHRLDVLHRAISTHLAAAGVPPTRPVSDLDRADFRADHTPNTLLDQLLQERPS
jgi:hypothetical protein